MQGSSLGFYPPPTALGRLFTKFNGFGFQRGKSRQHLLCGIFTLIKPLRIAAGEVVKFPKN